MSSGTEALIRRARGEKRDALGYAGAGGVTGLVMTLPIGEGLRQLNSNIPAVCSCPVQRMEERVAISLKVRPRKCVLGAIEGFLVS